MSLKNIFFQEKLENSVDKSTIQTDDYITVNGFKDLLCYYGGGIVDIEDYNVVDILLVCFSFYENDLLNVCIKYVKRIIIIYSYIKNHLNYKIMEKLMQHTFIFHYSPLSELHSFFQQEVKLMGQEIISAGILYIYIYII